MCIASPLPLAMKTRIANRSLQPFCLAACAIMDDVGAGVLDARYNMAGTYSAWLTKVKGGAAMHHGNAPVWVLGDISYSVKLRREETSVSGE